MPERDADYLKGFVWALGSFSDVEVARALADLAIECFRKIPNRGAVCSRAGNACVRVLGEMPGREPVAQLGRLRTRVKYTVGLQLIERALTAATVREGGSRQELEELAVPTFDLDATGTRVVILGDAVAEIRIAGSDEVAFSWRTMDGRALKTPGAPPSTPTQIPESSATAMARRHST